MKRLFFLGFLLTILSGLFSCRNEEERVYIRIKNNSSKNITNFWLGAKTRSYGAIISGETTIYKSLKPVTSSYNKFNFTTIANKRYWGTTFAKKDIGYIKLEPGYYTFSITVVNDTAVLHIINEPSPTR